MRALPATSDVSICAVGIFRSLCYQRLFIGPRQGVCKELESVLARLIPHALEDAVNQLRHVPVI